MRCEIQLMVVEMMAVLWLVAPLAPVQADDCDTTGLNDGPLQTTQAGIDFDVEFNVFEGTDACGASGNDETPLVVPQRIQNMLNLAVPLFGGFGFRTPYVNTLPDFD